jgi:hypothetical protein
MLAAAAPSLATSHLLFRLEYVHGTAVHVMLHSLTAMYTNNKVNKLMVRLFCPTFNVVYEKHKEERR